METRMNILIRDQVYCCRHSLFKGYGLTDDNSEQEVKQIATIILNRIDPWIDINSIAISVFNEMSTLVTDVMAESGTFEDYENEMRKLARHSSYQNYSSEVTSEALLKSIDWESIEEVFKKGLD